MWNQKIVNECRIHDQQHWLPQNKWFGTHLCVLTFGGIMRPTIVLFLGWPPRNVKSQNCERVPDSWSAALTSSEKVIWNACLRFEFWWAHVPGHGIFLMCIHHCIFAWEAWFGRCCITSCIRCNVHCLHVLRFRLPQKSETGNHQKIFFRMLMWWSQ